MRVLLAALVMFPATYDRAWAQTPPDAGSILREQVRPRPETTPAAPPPQLVAPAPSPQTGGARVFVKGLRIDGATLIPQAELLALLQPLIGAERSFGQLEAAALVLIGHYAERGYLARVTLPPQEIKDGVVGFRVVEGTRGALQVSATGSRIDAARAARFVEAALPAGSTLDLRALGQALNVLNEQPGIQARASLAPGAAESAVDISVQASEQPLLGWSLDLNNHGSRGMGEYQAVGLLTVRNPTGRFDAASLLLNAKDGGLYGRGEYSVAVGDRGLRLAGHLSRLDYRLVDTRFSALSAKGVADTVGVSASYPLLRRTTVNLTLNGALEQHRLLDRAGANELSRRTVSAGKVGLSGHAVQPGLGLVSFGLVASGGESEQHNAAAALADQSGRRVQGGFTKQSWNLGLERPVNAAWALAIALRGQIAQKNLDSSERFTLGGAQGVRAYPSGQAQGDEGWLASLELRGRLDERWALVGFVDSGQITVDHSAAVGTAVNRYRLTGAGIGIDWRVHGNAVLRTLLAAPLGNNPGQDSAGNNADGRAQQSRLWTSLQLQF